MSSRQGQVKHSATYTVLFSCSPILIARRAFLLKRGSVPPWQSTCLHSSAPPLEHPVALSWQSWRVKGGPGHGYVVLDTTPVCIAQWSPSVDFDDGTYNFVLAAAGAAFIYSRMVHALSRADDPTKAVEMKVYNQQIDADIAARLGHSDAKLGRVEVELARQMGQSCIYLPAGWWTYELCYLRHLRQIHAGVAGSPEQIHTLGEA